jgi:hypothetical protein
VAAREQKIAEVGTEETGTAGHERSSHQLRTFASGMRSTAPLTAWKGLR